MKIYVVGSSKNKFLPLDNIREKFLIDQPHKGDNIDFLNPWYCELTGLYYLWKHVDDEIVGLEHYRRYFVNSKNKLLSETEIKKLLETNDIIAYKYIGSNGITAMSKSKKGKELAMALAIVYDKYGENIASFFKSKLAGSYTFENNMFIGKKSILNDYFSFIFSILEEFDKYHKFKIPRIDGYIAEYFFGPWLEYNKLKIATPKRITYDQKLKRILTGHV